MSEEKEKRRGKPTPAPAQAVRHPPQSLKALLYSLGDDSLASAAAAEDVEAEEFPRELEETAATEEVRLVATGGAAEGALLVSVAVCSTSASWSFFG